MTLRYVLCNLQLSRNNLATERAAQKTASVRNPTKEHFRGFPLTQTYLSKVKMPDTFIAR